VQIWQKKELIFQELFLEYIFILKYIHIKEFYKSCKAAFFAKGSQ